MSNQFTDAMMISRPAPDDPPMIETTRLGVMAMHLVIRFLTHFFILRSKKPYRFYRQMNSLINKFSWKQLFYGIIYHLHDILSSISACNGGTLPRG